MIFVHGFGENKEADTLNALLWARSGYISLCYSVRGQGLSSGGTTIMGPAERQDLRAVVEYLATIPELNRAKIGIQGGSQGGLHVLWAAADSLSVAAGVADVITPRWASDMLANGSVRTSLALLLRTDGVRYAPVRDSLWALLREDRVDELRALFTAGRDVDTTVLHRSRIPLATFVKWQDHYFTVSDGIESFLRQQGPKYIYMGTGGHYSDAYLPELEYQWSVIGEWMEQFVHGVDTGVLGRPSLTFAYSSLPLVDQGMFSWERVALTSWPPPGIKSVRLYLNTDSTLTPGAPALEQGVGVIRNNWSRTYPLDSGFVDGFHGSRFNRNLPREVMAFTSDPLGSDFFWIGTPEMHMIVGSFYEKFPLHAQVFEVEPSGVQHLVNRIPFSARGWQPGLVGPIDARGLMHAHRFTAGNRIRVELSNIDADSKYQWGNVPFTVPMFAVTSAALFMDRDRLSWVELPLLGDPSLPNTIMALTAVADPSGQRVRISWQTPSELENAGFTVERKGAGETGFVPIGFLSAPGGPNSQGISAYTCIDSGARIGRWEYRIRQTSLSGVSHLSGTATVDIHTGLARDDQTPHLFALRQNYPNPFNPATTISFEVPRRERIRIEVFNSLGQRLATLLDEPLEQGSYTLPFDAHGYPSGVYLCRMIAGTFSAAQRMLLVK